MAETDYSLPKGTRLQGGSRTYVIEEKLGQGGFGITYRVKAPVKVGSIIAQADFALKEFFLSDSCERLSDSSIAYSNPVRERVENSRKDFLNEALRLRKIGFSHPNIVGFDEVFEANNTAYYVMEYLKGQSLDDYVAQHGPLSEQETVALLLPIFDAVATLHKNRICHLDIKPDNIMLTVDAEGRRRPVLIDFGLSKHYDKEGRATSTVNTFGYSEGYAPVEQYRGITTFSPAADIYALGATLYYCLTGKTPPAATEIRSGELADMLPPIVSSHLRHIVELMTRDQHDRPTSLSDLPALVSPDAYAPIEVETPESKATQRGRRAPCPVSVPDTPRNPRRSKYLLATGMGLAVGALVFIIIYYTLSSDTRTPESESVPQQEEVMLAPAKVEPEQPADGSEQSAPQQTVNAPAVVASPKTKPAAATPKSKQPKPASKQKEKPAKPTNNQNNYRHEVPDF